MSNKYNSRIKDLKSKKGRNRKLYEKLLKEFMKKVKEGIYKVYN